MKEAYDVYTETYAELEDAARDGIITSYIEEKGCEIVDRIAAMIFSPQTLPDEHLYAKIGKEFEDAIHTAIHDYAQAEADGKHTRDEK